MNDRNHRLPITHQAIALGIARSTVYSQPRSVSKRDLGLVERFGGLHLEMSFAGSSMLRELLALAFESGVSTLEH